MISGNLFAIMERMNISQIDLAKRAKISQSTLSGILHGTTPKKQTLAKLADALGVSEKELVEDSGSTKIFECPRCGSRSLVTWHNLGNDRYRFHCTYCDLDSGEQNGRAQAVRIFNSFYKVGNASSGNVHVLSLAELLDSSFANEDDVRPIWFENRGLFITPALVQIGVAEREQELVRVWWWNGNGNRSYMFNQYNSWWRCWSGKATQEMSDATPWDDK